MKVNKNKERLYFFYDDFTEEAKKELLDAMKMKEDEITKEEPLDFFWIENYFKKSRAVRSGV